MSKREDILKAILAKADPSANCTEAEAMEAIAQAHKYAEKYGLNIEDVRNKTSDAMADSHWSKGEPQFSAFKGGLDMVDKFCSTTIATTFALKCWVDRDSDGDSMIYFFGHDVDREAAEALRRVIRRAMKVEWEARKHFLKFIVHRPVTSSEMLSFHAGMGLRINERLSFFQRQAAETETGRELVSCKHALTEQHFGALGMNLHKRSGRGFKVDPNAFAAGRDAGNRVDFGRGVGSGKTLAIGSN